MDKRQSLGASGQQLLEFIAKTTDTNPSDWFFTFRGREALEVVCSQLSEERGAGSVITQLLTCSTLPEAIIAGGLTPVYADISADNLAVSPKSAAGAADDSLRAVIYQHSYGIFDMKAAEELKTLAESRSALFIEDCAHCALSLERDSQGKPLADVSLHSFGVEKLIKTSFGAAVWINPEMKDQVLRSSIVNALSELPLLSGNAAASVKSYRNRFRILSHLPARLKKPLRARWVAERKFIPAVAQTELEGNTLLEPSVPTDEVLSIVEEKLRTLEENRAQRLAAVENYIKELENTEGILIPRAAKLCPRSLLWLPIALDSPGRAERICSSLNSMGFYSSRWGRPLLYPGVADPEKFFALGADAKCPNAVLWSTRLVLLPTNREKPETDTIIAQVKKLAAEPSRPEDSFAAVLLGTETSVYNMARAFYEAYGIKSNAYGQKPLQQTADSKFVTVRCRSDFSTPEGFVSFLNREAFRYRGRKTLLLSCGDTYTKLLSACKASLDPVYIPVCPEEEVAYSVNFKARFYAICEKAGIPYPKTLVLKDSAIPEFDFGFPVVLKPDDADDYRDHPFEGQKKAFILKDMEALKKALSDTYNAGYSGRMLLQEFIPGGDENMRVVNGYKRSDGKLALMSMGQPLLEDYSPMAIGNYMVILSSGCSQVYDTVEKLMENIPYLGYFNLDLKYDCRDGIYKVFDFNPRMGRSSYYVTLAGNNLAKCVVEDYVTGACGAPKRADEEAVWADVPDIIVRKYVNPGPEKERALALMACGKSGGTFKKSGDYNAKRRIRQLKTDLRNIRNYLKYFVKK